MYRLCYRANYWIRLLYRISFNAFLLLHCPNCHHGAEIIFFFFLFPSISHCVGYRWWTNRPNKETVRTKDRKTGRQIIHSSIHPFIHAVELCFVFVCFHFPPRVSDRSLKKLTWLIFPWRLQPVCHPLDSVGRSKEFFSSSSFRHLNGRWSPQTVFKKNNRGRKRGSHLGIPSYATQVGQLFPICRSTPTATFGCFLFFFFFFHSSVIRASSTSTLIPFSAPFVSSTPLCEQWQTQEFLNILAKKPSSNRWECITL